MSSLDIINKKMNDFLKISCKSMIYLLYANYTKKNFFMLLHHEESVFLLLIL